jgi:uncharacterized protein YggU (UPF0235/DUF167 family)
MAGVWRPRADGIDLFVRLTPKAARDAIDGVEPVADGRAYLKARVRAVPEKGAANKRLERLIAKTLGVPPGNVNVVAGETARLKTLRLVGDPEVLAKAAERIGGEGTGGGRQSPI